MPDSGPDQGDETPRLPRWRAVGDLSDARRLQWRAVKASERLVYDAYEAGDREEARKAVTTLTQATRAYVSIVEKHELEERLERVERAIETQALHRQN